MPAAASPPATEAKKPAPAAAPSVKAPASAPAKVAAPASARGEAQAGAQRSVQAGAAQRFDRMAVRAKLAVSEPGDAVEREADAVAARVMRMPAPRAAAGAAPRQTEAAPTPAPAVKRQARPEIPADPGAAPQTSADLVSRLGPGQALEPEARAFFEPRLGTGLAHVRVHTDDAAADAARALQARAFTFGHHIAFASGEYTPHETGGRTLLAHELAHVLQNDTLDVSAVVQRKPRDPKYTDPADISEKAFDPALDKAARPALQTLNLPAIKARHADLYKGLAGGKSLKRPAGYDRRTPPFQTEQVKKWKEAVDLSKFYADIDFEPGAGRQWVTYFGAKARKIEGTEGEIVERLKVPNWSPDGTWSDSPLQVDHIVEVQLNGADAFDNYELLTGAHNTNVGSLLRAAIYANVKTYLGAVGKNVGDQLVKDYLETFDVPFLRVVAGEEGKNLERTARFWSRKEITAGKHLAWLRDEKRNERDDGTNKSRFALYAYTGEGFIDAFNLNKNKVSAQDSGRLAGIKVKRVDLTANLASANTGRIGTLTGTWELPKNVSVDGSSSVSLGLDAVPGKKYAGKLADAVKGPKLIVKGASPVSFGEMEFVRGKLNGDGVLSPEHALFTGLQIPVRWRGDELAFEYTVPVTALQGKLPVPGLTIDDASLTLFLTPRGIGADGMLSFSVAGLGAGVLTVTVQTRGGEPEISAAGRFIADRKLFDEATLVIGYSTKKGFFGEGTLGITTPGKIKGLKSARLKAGYAQGVFSALGEVVPDLPGLKTASLSVSYGQRLAISGTLGIDEKVPGVEVAEITVTVTEGDSGWKVAASGDVTPRLPGLKGAKLKFSYDDGAVLLEGHFEVKNRLIEGSVTAGVTNAPVDDQGKPLPGGEGHTFTPFGSADLGAKFGPLTGKVKLIVKPDGRVFVGGKLVLADQELFGQYPKGDAAHHDLASFSTPAIPLVGFSVAGVGVGLMIYAGGDVSADAAIGPGWLKDVMVELEPLDLGNFDPALISVNGGARLVVYAKVGLSVAAWIKAELDALVARVGGQLTITGTAGLPADKPVLDAAAKFKWNEATGLDVAGQLKFNAQPRLEFGLTGELYAKIGRWRFTYTVWSREYSFGKVAYDLPVALSADTALAWNSRTGFNFDPKDVLSPPKPSLDENNMKSLADSGPKEKSVDVLDEEDRPEGEPRAPVSVVRRQVQPGAAPPASLIGVSDQDLAALGPGRPLPDAVRVDFEQRLRADLSTVRVHDSEAAATLAAHINARAFTVGAHIVFNDGAYEPGTEPGRLLLAHELAHVVQQQGSAARQLMPNGTGATPAAPPSETPAQRTTRTQRELQAFVLPASKRRHGHTYHQWFSTGVLKHGPNYDREVVAPAQISKWETALAGLDAQTAWTQHYARLGLDPAAAGNQTLVFTGGRTESRPFVDWASYFKRPQWSHGGTWLNHRLEVDHIVELQAAGWPASSAGDTVQNYELLDKSTNASSGGTLYAAMRQKMRALLAAEQGVPVDQIPLRPAAPGTGGAGASADAETMLRTRGVSFAGFEGGSVGDARGGGRRGDASSEYWTVGELQAGEHLAAINSPATGGSESGTAGSFVLLSAATGGMVIARFPTLSAGPLHSVSGTVAGRLASMTITGLTLNAGYGTAAAGDGMGALAATWQLPPGISPTSPNASFTLNKAQAGQFNGWLQAPAAITTEAAALSPIEFNQVGIDGRGINASGQLRPTLPLIGSQPIDVSWTHDNIRFARTFSADQLSLSVPGLSLDAASLSVFYDRDGFGAEGGVYFTIAHVGTGSLTAGVDGAGRFSAEGSLDVDTRVFDEANVRVWYRDGAFGAAGRVGINQPGRISGVNAASIDVSADAHRISARGTLQPALPGVRNATLIASYSAEGGLVVGGDLQIAKVPGIQEGSMHAELRKREDRWTVSATGRAVPALPGVNSAINATYDDGVFDGEITVDYARSIFSGAVTVGITNRLVSPDGELLSGPPAAPTGDGGGAAPGGLVVFGSGSVTARLSDALQGSVGVKVRPSGDILISGRIGLVDAVTIFEQYPSAERARRTLFSMPPVSVPLVGLAVGGTVVGVALTINGRATGHASIGPGRLTQADIGVDDFNPARPETLQITGGATFDLPARCGIGATLDAAVSLGAGIVRADAGLSLSAEAALHADVSPHVDVVWRASTGLHLHADLEASLAPRLAFDVSGYAEVIGNAVITTFSLWRKDWNLLHREVGSSLALRMNAPVDYYSNGRGVEFNPAAVRLQAPPLNRATFDQLLNNEGGTERVERPAVGPAGGTRPGTPSPP